MFFLKKKKPPKQTYQKVCETLNDVHKKKCDHPWIEYEKKKMTSTENTLDSSQKYSSPLSSVLETAEKIGFVNVIIMQILNKSFFFFWWYSFTSS